MSVIGFFSDKSDAKAQLDAFNAVHCDHFEYDVKSLLDTVQAGDVVVFHEFYNAGPSMRDALAVIESIHDRGADFVCNGSDLDSRTSPDVYRTIDAIYKLALEEPKPEAVPRHRVERAAAGGRATAGGRRGRASIDAAIIDEALERYKNGEPVKAVCEAAGISQGTLYKYVRARGIKRG